MAYDSVALAALADPTRRRVFELVARGPRSVAALVHELPVSQPAVSQHLKVLKAARLVRAEPRGASNIYHVDPEGLGAIRRWLDGLWTDAMAAFADACEAEERESK